MTRAQHDPGGKTRLRLPDGVSGDAVFSDCGRYRHQLSRDWTAPGQRAKSVLFVGLNPSVASADVSDPTCHRELMFAQDWGFTRYLKANILDWRATSPRDIPHDPAKACSAQNMPTLLRLAAAAELIVMATGNVNSRYASIEFKSVAALQQSGKPLKCLGKNKSGHAKHPLYLRKDTRLEPY